MICAQHVPIDRYKQNVAHIIERVHEFPTWMRTQPIVLAPPYKVHDRLNSDLQAVHSEKMLMRYVHAAKEVASEAEVPFVNVHTDLKTQYISAKKPPTRYVEIAGLDITEYGYKVCVSSVFACNHRY